MLESVVIFPVLLSGCFFVPFSNFSPIIFITTKFEVSEMK